MKRIIQRSTADPSCTPTGDEQTTIEKIIPADQKEFLNQKEQSVPSYKPCHNPTTVQWDQDTYEARLMMLQKIFPIVQPTHMHLKLL